jgi:hypothetical protein
LIAGGRTYSSSKLCNVLTARALAVHPDTTTRRLVIIAYDPGHTPGSGLVRNGNFVINFLWKRLAPALRLMLSGSNTPEAAGHTLAKLAQGPLPRDSSLLKSSLM